MQSISVELDFRLIRLFPPSGVAGSPRAADPECGTGAALMDANTAKHQRGRRSTQLRSGATSRACQGLQVRVRQGVLSLREWQLGWCALQEIVRGEACHPTPSAN